VKVYNPLRNCGTTNGLSNINDPSNVPPPTANPFTVAPEYGTCGTIGKGHTVWADGNTHETAVTTAWPPNKAILDPVTGADLDTESRLPVQGGPVFAAITARSYPPGGVNTLFADGSVRFIKSTISGQTWRSLGSIRGGEVVSADSY